MSDHLSAGILCPHCGERYRVESKKNKTGDTVRRGVCPQTPVGTAVPLWSSPWEMERRA